MNKKIHIVIPVRTTPEEDKIDREVEEYFAKQTPPKTRKIFKRDGLKGSDGSKS